MKHPEMVAAGLRSIAQAPALSRDEKMASVIKMFAAEHGDKVFKMPRYVEYTPARLLKHRSTDGTVLAPIVTHLNQIGIATEANMAGVMQSLELNRDQLHRVSCYCHQATIDGAQMSRGLAHLVSYGSI